MLVQGFPRRLGIVRLEQTVTSLMNLGERKSRNVVDHDAKYATEYLVVAAWRA